MHNFSEKGSHSDVPCQAFLASNRHLSLESDWKSWISSLSLQSRFGVKKLLRFCLAIRFSVNITVTARPVYQQAIASRRFVGGRRLY
jgi:hypothetical protein